METQTDRDLVNRALSGLVDLGVVPPDARIEHVYLDDIWPGYVLLQLGDKDKVAKILNLLSDMGIISVGRYGRWTYMSMEDSFLDGLGAVGYAPTDIMALFPTEKRI